MSVSQIAARYSAPTSAYLAEVKATHLSDVAISIAHATRAHDAGEAERLLGTAERRLEEILDAIRTAKLDIERESDRANVVEFDKAPESFQQVGAPAANVVGRLVPRSIPVKSAGAMGTTTPGPEAA